MAPLASLSRPLLAAMFVVGGVDSVRDPETKVAVAERVVEPVTRALEMSASTADCVRLNGAVQVVAGAALALGVVPRVAAAVLVATLVPVTLAGHRFWEADGDDRVAQQIHFLKNCAMAGGLLAVIDTH